MRRNARQGSADRGATLVEYALIAALLTSVVAVGAKAAGDAMSGRVKTQSDKVQVQP